MKHFEVQATFTIYANTMAEAYKQVGELLLTVVPDEDIESIAVTNYGELDDKKA